MRKEARCIVFLLCALFLPFLGFIAAVLREMWAASLFRYFARGRRASIRTLDNPMFLQLFYDKLDPQLVGMS